MKIDNPTARRIAGIALLMSFFVTAMMLASLYKVTTLKIAPPEELLAVSVDVNSTSKQLAKRGQLLDRRGRILAASVLGYTLFVDPSLVQDQEKLAFELGAAVDIPPAIIEQKIRSRPNSRYVVLKPLLNEEEITAILQIDDRSVGLTQRLVREYPHGEIGAALIGMVGTEHTGLAGIENTFNEELKGESGRFVWQRDTGNRTVWVSPENFTPTHEGGSVQLSIDVVIQDIATKRLTEEVLRCNAGGGRIVVVDPRSGEILAMVDVLHPRQGWSQETQDPNRTINPRLGRNRCISDPYEPGSTFKPFIWSVATELGKATIEEVLPTPWQHPYRTTFGRIIRDAHYYGPSTWRRVLVKSMNSGMAIVSQRMTYKQLQDAVRRFGFGEKTNIGLGGETIGIITSSANWNDYTQTSVSMGHEIAVTPVQMVQAFCAFARDGTVPQIQLSVTDPTDVVFVRQAITPEIAALTRQILAEVMTEGTGRKSQSEQYALFGKSGTAQLPRSDGKGYFEHRYVASFIAGAPLDDPAIVVLCVIDDPDKSIDHYGGVVAGPVVRDVIDLSLNYLGVPPSTSYLARTTTK